MEPRAKVAYVIEPRFPGGTSAAVARELEIVAGLAQVEVHAIASAMFPERDVAPVIAETLERLGLALRWNAGQIAADVVILHNPSFLKFDAQLSSRIVARHLIAVTHENFLRPGGFESFDAGHCLGLIDRASLAVRKSLAPISTWNRATVLDWLAGTHAFRGWSVLPEDWHNICDFPICPPNATPSDRRGRHSRPGMEKFPSLDQMDLCFPRHAEANVILGADTLIREGVHRPHWRMIPFGGLEIPSYFDMIDFMVYFTAPTLRESFGRVLAEGIAAGKVVISDPATAAVFDGAVIAAEPGEVDAIVTGFVQDPAAYASHVAAAQAKLTAFSSAAFLARHGGLFHPAKELAA